jgi:uncharacterized protein
MKFLLWVLIGVAIVMWLMHGRKAAGRAASPDRAASHTGAGSEAMLLCAHCNVHFPASEAIAGMSGKVFCCEEHRLRHAAR